MRRNRHSLRIPGVQEICAPPSRSTLMDALKTEKKMRESRSSWRRLVFSTEDVFQRYFSLDSACLAIESRIGFMASIESEGTVSPIANC